MNQRCVIPLWSCDKLKQVSSRDADAPEFLLSFNSFYGPPSWLSVQWMRVVWTTLCVSRGEGPSVCTEWGSWFSQQISRHIGCDWGDGEDETEVSEKPQKELQEDSTKGEESKLLKARVKHFSTRRKTHHVETAEVIFNDQPSDENDDDILTVPWKLFAALSF